MNRLMRIKKRQKGGCRMSLTLFTVEEENLICVYDVNNRSAFSLNATYFNNDENDKETEV
jgi:hypothetical protein